MLRPLARVLVSEQAVGLGGFGDDRQDRLANCEACLVTGSYGQDGACNDACGVYAVDAWYCPCRANRTDYGWHDSRTSCAVNCPRGLACC